GWLGPLRFTEPITCPDRTSAIQMLPFSPPERYTRWLSGENVTPRNVALTSTRFAVGAAASRCVMSVSENGPAPLFAVASVAPSGDSAIPSGLGAPTLTSIPAGVTNRPFGRIAVLTPLMTVSVVAGRLPAGAENFRKSDGRPSGSPRDADATHIPTITITA